MFRLIKKWYFKIYHLFKLIGIFLIVFFIPLYVKADECKLIYKSIGANLVVDTTSDYYVFPSEDGSTKYNPELDINKDYTMFMVDNEDNIYSMANLSFRRLYFVGNLLTTSNYQKESVTKKPTANKGELFQFYGYNNALAINSYEIMKDKTIYVVEGTNVCIPQEEPTPEPSDNIYSSFLTLYIDKINYLTNGFTNNPYLLAMIGIIFSWIVLELFLQILHLRGGYKK